jgi:hypothetical protein
MNWKDFMRGVTRALKACATEENLQLAVNVVEMAQRGQGKPDEKRVFAVSSLQKTGIPESTARLLVELAVTAMKAQAAKKGKSSSDVPTPL